MRALWNWYKARRWWTKILVGLPTVLLAVALLYVLVRAVQYQGATGASAAEFLPAGADATLRISDAAGHWERIKRTPFWKILQGRMLRDPAVRRALNTALSLGDLPPYEELTDPRFVDRQTRGMLDEDRVLALAGRDVVLAVKLGPGPDGVRFVTATRLGFGYYLLLPFVPLALDSRQVQGHACLDAQGFTLSIQDAVVVVSNDDAMMAAALRRKGPREPSKKPVELSVAFDGSPLLSEVRRDLNGFPAGAVLLFADAQAMKRVTLSVDVDGHDLLVEGWFEGMVTHGAAAAPDDPMRYLPASGTGAAILNVGGDRLWDWASAVATSPPRSTLDRIGQEVLQDAVQILNDQQFGTRVVPHIRGPMGLLLGSSIGEERRTFTSAAFVFRSDNPAAADAGLREVIQEMIPSGQDQFRVAARIVQGRTVWSLDYISDPFKLTDYLRPCWVAFDDALVLANNLDFAMEVTETAYGGASAFQAEPHVKSALDRLNRLGMNRVLADGSTASGFLYAPSFREGLEGFWPILANWLADNDAARQKLRQELEAEFRASGRPILGRDFVQAFNQAMEARIEDMAERLRQDSRALDYFRWAAFQVTQEPGGMRLKASIELK